MTSEDYLDEIIQVLSTSTVSLVRERLHELKQKVLTEKENLKRGILYLEGQYGR